ncbi:polymorphic toxin-type HINT domain-containing protein [Amycolatopsis sp. EV170708-02-1]|uniref:polymorphic toxin-type HINT domain-containing protein n=1 Tax=Amycolatopsis sp. EV170708-02-1 TaxID=2919322 RepID=UPI001F0B7B27|nr:polymorphic toxin-type HINT domain-containing protein [Amycolatopsis sp. EV170708-02-1]UMP02495.1 hypothetical protein MJQ72_39985 [Amycolatopsis sp. EV170708-02-1]
MAEFEKVIRNPAASMDYWVHPLNVEPGVSACFGEMGCDKAWKYLSAPETENDLEGAKVIAATYCVDNYDECQQAAGVQQLGRDLLAELAGMVGGGNRGNKGAGDTGSPAGECATPNSFVAGTLVLLAGGVTKPIEEVKVGDEVVATDPETGRTESQPVIATIVGEGQKNLVRLTVDVDGPVGDRIGAVIATDEHPFWSPGRASWVDATDLKAGDNLRTEAGAVVTVVKVDRWEAQRQRVYNLTIDSLHTYHVLVGETPVLVHNTNCWSSKSNKTSVENAFGHWQKHKSEFPNLNNAKEYVEAATAFLNSADANVLKRTRQNGDVVRFNPRTNEFGVMDPSGVPRTYFIPNPATHGYPTNLDYFNAQ